MSHARALRHLIILEPLLQPWWARLLRFEPRYDAVCETCGAIRLAVPYSAGIAATVEHRAARWRHERW